MDTDSIRIVAGQLAQAIASGELDPQEEVMETLTFACELMAAQHPELAKASVEKWSLFVGAAMSGGIYRAAEIKEARRDD